MEVAQLSRANADAVSDVGPSWADLVPGLLAAQDSGASVTLVAFSRGRAAGLAELVLSSTPQLRCLGVLPGHRARDVAAELVRVAEHRAVRHGRLAVSVGRGRPEVRRLCERRGYRPTRRDDDVLVKQLLPDGLPPADDHGRALTWGVVRPQVEFDAEADAGSVIFETVGPQLVGPTIPIDYHGSLLGTVTFSKEGRLVDVELLDARHRLPDGIVWDEDPQQEDRQSPGS